MWLIVEGTAVGGREEFTWSSGQETGLVARGTATCSVTEESDGVHYVVTVLLAGVR